MGKIEDPSEEKFTDLNDLYGIFASELGDVRIPPEREKGLWEIVVIGRCAREAVWSDDSLKKMSPEEILKSCRCVSEGELAKRKIVLAHIPFVIDSADELINSGRAYRSDQLDLIQVGVMRLLKATQTYNPHDPSGASFLGYAGSGVVWNMLTQIRRERNSLYVPEKVLSLAMFLFAKVQRWKSEHGIDPDEGELMQIASDNGLSDKDIRNALNVWSVKSLVPLSGVMTSDGGKYDDDDDWESRIPGPNDGDPLYQLIGQELQETVRGILWENRSCSSENIQITRRRL